MTLAVCAYLIMGLTCYHDGWDLKRICGDTGGESCTMEGSSLEWRDTGLAQIYGGTNSQITEIIVDVVNERGQEPRGVKLRRLAVDTALGQSQASPIFQVVGSVLGCGSKQTTCGEAASIPEGVWMVYDGPSLLVETCVVEVYGDTVSFEYAEGGVDWLVSYRFDYRSYSG